MLYPSACKWFLTLIALYGFAANTYAGDPLQTSLKPKTIAQFDAYAHKVEQTIQTGSPIAVDPATWQKVRTGSVLVQSASRNPIEITDGLVHDWTGIVFFPHTQLSQVLHVLQDFDHHATIYPDMTQSRLLHRNGDQLSGLWRIERRTGVIQLALDVYDDANYRQVAPNRWICIAHARKILQVQDAGTANEKTLPEGQGYGFLWRLYGYWTLEARDGGVLAQCRTVSLSRGVPLAVSWIVNPIVREQPRESLLSTLRATRNALDRRANQAENAIAEGQ